MIGTLLAGRYELTGRLAEGPVFSLYTARDRQQGRDVGLRLIRAPYDHEPRFLDELSSAVSRQTGLNNPAVEALGGVEKGDWGAFLYGDVTRGPSLQDRIRKLAPFSVPVSLDLAISLLKGLEALHRNGIVHGDVSPGNVVVMPNGTARLQLAGIWEAYHASPEAAKAVYPGMAPYLAPEVSAGEMPGPRSDLYAAGVVLFELLVGRQPYHGDTPATILRRHEEDETPDIRAFNPAVPIALAGMVAKAMAKDPQDRYASAAELLSDLKSQQDALRFGKTLAWPPPSSAPAAAQPVKAVPTPKKREKPRSTEPEPVAPKMGAIRDEEPEPRRRGQDRDVPAWMLAILAVLMAVVIGLMGVWFLFNMNKPKLVRVPEIEGLSLSEARDLLDPLHLELRVAGHEPNDKVPQEHILDASSDTGDMVREGGRISVIVSGGSRFVQMPDLKGYTPDRARSVLEGLGLEVDPVSDETPSEIPVGNVVSQTPSARTKIDRQSRVRLTLSTGPGGEANTSTPDKAYAYNIEVAIRGVSRPVRVRIEISDVRGTRPVYEERKADGETASTTVRGYGDKATFRIYYDDELVKEFEQSAS
ncbi:serine/threonine-protein kinase [bacterium]|nr:MAG: serine/threonine-protein kinase [bacterium]